MKSLEEQARGLAEHLAVRMFPGYDGGELPVPIEPKMRDRARFAATKFLERELVPALRDARDQGLREAQGASVGSVPPEASWWSGQHGWRKGATAKAAAIARLRTKEAP